MLHLCWDFQRNDIRKKWYVPGNCPSPTTGLIPESPPQTPHTWNILNPRLRLIVYSFQYIHFPPTHPSIHPFLPVHFNSSGCGRDFADFLSRFIVALNFTVHLTPETVFFLVIILVYRLLSDHPPNRHSVTVCRFCGRMSLISSWILCHRHLSMGRPSERLYTYIKIGLSSTERPTTTYSLKLNGRVVKNCVRRGWLINNSVLIIIRPVAPFSVCVLPKRNHLAVQW